MKHVFTKVDDFFQPFTKTTGSSAEKSETYTLKKIMKYS